MPGPRKRGQFAEVLASYPCYAARWLQPILAEPLDPDRRLHATYVHSLIGVRRSGLDGEAGLLDFLLSSAATVRAALESAETYLRLWSDLHQLSLEVREDRAIVRLRSTLPTPARIDELLMSCLLRHHVYSWHAQAEAVVHVASGSFDFPTWLLDLSLRRRNRRLHAVLRHAADRMLATLPVCVSFSERVDHCLREALHDASLARVARELEVHPRTLSRALLREGTTFQALVARARKDAALHWLGDAQLTLTEVARRSGFQSKAPFHRSFRRWTGQTPASYRRQSIRALGVG